jgi:hypothetical protein
MKFRLAMRHRSFSTGEREGDRGRCGSIYNPTEQNETAGNKNCSLNLFSILLKSKNKPACHETSFNFYIISSLCLQ